MGEKNSKYLALGGKHLGVTQAEADYVRSRIVVENSGDTSWNVSVGSAVDRLVQVPFLVKMLQEYLNQHPNEKFSFGL